jgi:hypothetical protein
MNISQLIREDPKAVQLLTSAVTHKGRKWFDANGEQVHVQKEIRKLGYNLSASSLFDLMARLNGTYKPRKARQARLEASGVVADTKIAKPQKPAPSVTPATPELIVDVPGIYEVENRGRGTRSFNFTSTIDGSTFSFPSFKEAREARQAMMRAFRGQAVFESVVRQKTGKKPEADELDE